MKTKIFKILTARFALHIYFWSVLFCAWVIITHTESTTLFFSTIYGLSIVGLALPPVYLHFYIFERYLPCKRYGVYALLLMVIIVAFGLIDYHFFTRVFNDQNGPVTFMFNMTWLLVITTALKLIKQSIRQRWQMQEIKTKQLQTELSLLKAQIQPHFLFNTLNNLFSMARRQDDRTADGIARLSHLMRYMIHDSGVDDIALEKEIEQIHRFVELQKLRFSDTDDVSIDINVRGDLSDIRLPPLLLISFVENAFKHGISLQHPSFIKIDLDIQDSRIRFSVQNSRHPCRSIETEGAGLGLQNVRRRLDLLFPDAHDLKIFQDEAVYKIDLTLWRKDEVLP